ncbi:hypothetical protein AKJ57_04895 [candidate division MSBL1 archaeon SCGC-AAA259A05]|uniref:Polyketide cyclase n=1 Tax=candidate division MSBL1 archaeon SCGC-AAA259A05 TaxID=1698259 RepID=A0A133U6J4_9EURY|nr:hypothetical protein AKJ57_04895 [candidate division MSBL1 archaeon SCGC-AAA259A05]
MKVVEEKIDIYAPREKVWNYLVDQKRAEDWDPGVDHVEYLSDKRKGEGTKTLYRTKRVFGKELEFVMDIKKWKENDEIEFVDKLEDEVFGFKKIYGDWILEKLDKGTEFTWEFGFVVDSLRKRFMWPLLKYGTSKTTREAIEGLKETVEEGEHDQEG